MSWARLSGSCAVILSTAACNAISGVNEYSLTSGTGGQGMGGQGMGGQGMGGGGPNFGGKTLWFKTTGDVAAQAGTAIAADASNNVVISGWTAGTIDFGGDPVGNGGGAFLARVDPAGQFLWVATWPTGGAAQSLLSTGLAVDQGSNMILSSPLNTTVDLGSGQLVGDPMGSLFLAKWDATNVPQWSRGFGAGVAFSAPRITTGASGDIYLLVDGAGGTVDFGAGPYATGMNHSLFVARFDPAGKTLWSRQLSNPGHLYAGGVATGPTGDIYIAGKVDAGDLDIGCAPGPLATQGYSMFVAKLDAGGKCVWNRSVGGNTPPSAVASDAQGNLHIVGSFTQDFSLDGVTLHYKGAPSTFAIYVIKLDPAGKLLWGKAYGGTGAQSGDAISIDPAGGVVISGHFIGDLDLGRGAMKSASVSDLFVAALDQGGETIWSRSMKNPATTAAPCHSAVDGDGNVLLTGYFTGSIDFGDAPPRSSQGAEDIYYAKVSTK